MTSEKTTKVCEDCGAPATHVTSDGVPLCEADWQRLLNYAENMDELPVDNYGSDGSGGW